MPLCSDLLVKEASGLPYAERAKLVDALLTTLDPVTEYDCDVAWFAEIGRREQSIADGTAQIHSWDEVKRQARERVNANYQFRAVCLSLRSSNCVTQWLVEMRKKRRGAVRHPPTFALPGCRCLVTSRCVAQRVGTRGKRQ